MCRVWGKGFPGRAAQAKALGVKAVLKDPGLSEKLRSLWLWLKEQGDCDMKWGQTVSRVRPWCGIWS